MKIASRVAILLRIGLLLAGLALAVQSALRAADPEVDLPGRQRLGAPVLVALAGGALVALAAAAAVAVAELRNAELRNAELRNGEPGRGVAPAGGLALRLAGEAFVAAATFVLVRLQPFQDPHTRFVLTLAAGGWAVALLALAARGARPLPRPLAVVELIAFNLCLFAVLAEVALRGFAAVAPSPLTGREGGAFVQAMRRENPPGSLRFGFPLDAEGYFDEALDPGDARPIVVAVGDSFSYGVVPHRFHYTTVAERALGERVAVVNLGYPGAGPREYAEMLRLDGLPLRPAAVVVALFVGNDLAELQRAEVAAGLLAQLFDRDRSRLYGVTRRLWRLAVEARARPGARPGEVPGEATPERLESPESLRASFPWLFDSRLEVPTFTADRYLGVERTRATAAASPAADYGPLVAFLAELGRSVAPTPLLVALVPDDFQLDDELWAGIAADRPGLERDLPQRRLVAGLEAAGAPVLDLLPVLRAACAPRPGDRHCYHRRDTHWNARGNCLAGQALAAALAPLLGLPADGDPACVAPTPDR